MATVEELQQASSELRALADEVRQINAPVEASSGPDILSGGNLGDSLAEFIAEQGIRGLGISADVDELASFAAIAAALQELEEIAAPAQPATGLT